VKEKKKRETRSRSRSFFVLFLVFQQSKEGSRVFIYFWLFLPQVDKPHLEEAQQPTNFSGSLFACCCCFWGEEKGKSNYIAVK
jgi:hypothetical protein